MAKKVVKYLLEGVGTVPACIADGGYWPVGHELVGLTYDDTERYVAASFVSMSKADLVARLASMGLKNPDTQELLDAPAQAAMLQAWLDMIGLSDLA